MSWVCLDSNKNMCKEMGVCSNSIFYKFPHSQINNEKVKQYQRIIKINGRKLFGFKSFNFKLTSMDTNTPPTTLNDIIR